MLPTRAKDNYAIDEFIEAHKLLPEGCISDPESCCTYIYCIDLVSARTFVDNWNDAMRKHVVALMGEAL